MQELMWLGQSDLTRGADGHITNGSWCQSSRPLRMKMHIMPFMLPEMVALQCGNAEMSTTAIRREDPSMHGCSYFPFCFRKVGNTHVVREGPQLRADTQNAVDSLSNMKAA